MTPRVTRKALLATMRRLGACSEAIAWVEANPAAPSRLWALCPRGDWMLWIAARIDIHRPALVLAACDCARTVLHLVPAGEDRPRVAIETAERWARGEATIQDVRAAANAANAANAARHASRADAARLVRARIHWSMIAGRITTKRAVNSLTIERGPNGGAA